MLSPIPMRKVRIFVLARDEGRVTGALAALGVLHLRSSVEESGGELQPEDLQGEIDRCTDLLRRLEGLSERLGVEAPLDLPAGDLPGIGDVEELVASLEERTAEQRGEATELEEGIRDTGELVERLAPYREVRSSLTRLAGSELLSVTAVRGAPEELAAMRRALPPGALVVALGDEAEGARSQSVLIVSGRRRRFAIDTVLEERAVERIKVPTWGERTPADVYGEAVARQRQLVEHRDAVRASLRGTGQAYAAMLQRGWGALTLQLRFCSARKNFGTTWATVVITGWVPAERADEVRGTLADVTQGRCVVQTSEPTAEEIEADLVPSRLRQSRLLSPFQRLVQGYGVPSYTEIEPTLLFAASFLLLFGLIFGDLGHGLCLIATGLLARRLGKKAVVRDAGHVIAACGLASALFGAFFQGSFFGVSLADAGFPFTLGFEPMRFEGGGDTAAGHVMRYLVLALGAGVVLISLGGVLNVINRLRRGDVEEGLLGRFGLAGILFYWGALGLVVKLLLAGGGGADLWWAVALIGVPLAVLAVHRPLYSLVARRRPVWKEGALIGVFEGLIEAVETVMVYLANTFSFLRVAAFALSHAALCFTIFVLERLVHGLPGGLIWSSAVFALGTAVIITLEGLIVAIQILRLEYYEFFTKFFRGEGVRYEPFRLGADREARS